MRRERHPSEKRYGWLRLYDDFWDHPQVGGLAMADPVEDE